jgi:hypothetical protein
MGNQWRGADYVGYALVEAWHERCMNPTEWGKDARWSSPYCPFNHPECDSKLGLDTDPDSPDNDEDNDPYPVCDPFADWSDSEDNR